MSETTATGPTVDRVDLSAFHHEPPADGAGDTAHAGPGAQEPNNADRALGRLVIGGVEALAVGRGGEAWRMQPDMRDELVDAAAELSALWGIGPEHPGVRLVAGLVAYAAQSAAASALARRAAPAAPPGEDPASAAPPGDDEDNRAPRGPGEP